MAKPDEKGDGANSSPSSQSGAGPPPSTSPSPAPVKADSRPQQKTREFQAVVATSTQKGAEINLLRRPPLLLACYRIGGILFAFDRSFVRDNSVTVRSLNMVKKGLETYPDGKLAIFGHADYVNTEAYNKELSERRAEAVYALLTLNEGTWKRLYSKEEWGKDRSISSILKDDLTSIRDYMEKLLKKAGLNKVPDNNFCPIWPSSGRKHPYMGCSEFNPHRIFNAAQLRAHEKNHRLRDRENAPNRRVVLFLFEKNHMPLFPCMHSSEKSAAEAAKHCDIPKNWKQNREYKRHVTPTFACKFYDSQVSRYCPEELTVPKLVSYPSAVILIQGYELGLRADRYNGSELWDAKDPTGNIKTVGLVFSFKNWANFYYNSFLSDPYEKREQIIIRFRAKIDQLKKRLSMVTDKDEREEIEWEIFGVQCCLDENLDMAEVRLVERSKGEYLSRIAGSILQDKWVVEKLSRSFKITSTAQADPPPDKPIPFKPIDWDKAVMIERRGGQGFERSLLEYRAEELAEWVAVPPLPKGYKDSTWERWATEQGKTEMRARLSGRSIPIATPNGKGYIKRATTGMAAVGFGQGQTELDEAAKNDLLNWIKNCVNDAEMPYPPERIGETRCIFDSNGEVIGHRFMSYVEVWKKRRDNFKHMDWRVYVFPAPSMKEWQDGKAEDLTKKRAEHIGKILQGDAALKDVIVSGWGGRANSPWAPPAVDFEQVWKLAEIAAGS